MSEWVTQLNISPLYRIPKEGHQRIAGLPSGRKYFGGKCCYILNSFSAPHNLDNFDTHHNVLDILVCNEKFLFKEGFNVFRVYADEIEYCPESYLLQKQKSKLQ